MLTRIKQVFAALKEKKSKKEAINFFVKEVQKLLISSDVEIKTVIELTSKLRERLEQELLPGVDYVLVAKKVLADLLLELVGKEGGKLNLEQRPTFILLIGLYGHGKTTTAAKLARYLRSRGLKVACVCLDTQRPAAYEQLRQLSEKAGADFYGDTSARSSLEILDRVLPQLRRYDAVIFDSAGRDDLNEELVQELRKLKERLQPQEILLVLDAATGRVARRLAERFAAEVGITGIILTKMDSSAKAGGALAACAASGAKIKFIGTGEHLEDFEPFNPKEYIKRVVGIADLDGLYRQVEAVLRRLKDEEQLLEEAAERMLTGKMTLLDFYLYLKSITKESPLDKLLCFVPGAEEQVLGIAKDKIKKYLIICSSLRRSELLDPSKLLKNRKRLLKVAIGAGVREEDVLQLIQDYNRVRVQVLQLLKNRELRARGPLGRVLGKLLR
ncbi:MAG: signal recognition particle protein Srp19 [bacterium]|nr:signal recognition particle protein Srp19 [bacterium]